MTTQEMARIAIGAKQYGDPRYHLLVQKVMLMTNMSAPRVEANIAELASGATQARSAFDEQMSGFASFYQQRRK